MSYPDYGSPDQPSGYPPREPYYPPNGHPPQGGYPAPPQGYPPQGGYPPDQTWSGYPQPRGYPPPGGYPQEPTWGHPQQGGYPPQGGGYAQPGGYPQQGGYPPDNGFRQGGYTDQAQPGLYGGYEEPRAGRTQPRRYEPPKKSRKGIWITLVLLFLLCGGGGTAIYVFYGDRFKDVADTASQAAKTTVAEPATLSGRPQNTTPDLAKAASEMRASIKKDIPNAQGSAAAYYGAADKKNLVMVIAVAAPILDEDKAMSDFLSGFSKEFGNPTFETTEAGPLGGKAKCANGKVSNVPLAVCVWVDKGSLGAIMYYEKTVDQIKAEFVNNRGQIEKQG